MRDVSVFFNMANVVHYIRLFQIDSTKYKRNETNTKKWRILFAFKDKGIHFCFGDFIIHRLLHLKIYCLIKG